MKIIIWLKFNNTKDLSYSGLGKGKWFLSFLCCKVELGSMIQMHIEAYVVAFYHGLPLTLILVHMCCLCSCIFMQRSANDEWALINWHCVMVTEVIHYFQILSLITDIHCVIIHSLFNVIQSMRCNSDHCHHPPSPSWLITIPRHYITQADGCCWWWLWWCGNSGSSLWCHPLSSSDA